MRPPGFPLPEHLAAHIFSLLPVQDRGRLAQACRYTAHVARTYHVFADTPCFVNASTRDRISMAVDQRRRTVHVGDSHNVVPILQAFCEAFAGKPYQVCAVATSIPRPHHFCHDFCLAVAREPYPYGDFHSPVLDSSTPLNLLLQIEKLQAVLGSFRQYGPGASASAADDWAVVWGMVSQLQPLRYLALSAFISPPANLTFSPAEHLRFLRVLDLGNNSLTEVPSALQHLTQLVDLRLDRNLLATLPEWLSGLSRLQHLGLSNNHLAHIPDTVTAALTQLTRLDLMFNALTALPPSLYGLANLRDLSLAYNGLASISDDIQRLRALTSLEVRGNRLQALPETIGNLPALRRCYFDDNEAIFLPDSLFGLTTLQEWVLMFGDEGAAGFSSSAGTDILPECFGGLVGLRELALDGDVRELPSSLSRLTNLVSVNLSGLQSFPPSLGSLVKVTSLDIGFSDGALFPDSYGNLTALESIRLESCDALQRLPTSMANLKNVTLLIASGCGSLGASGAEGIECIGGMAQLQKVDLRLCGLAEVCCLLGVQYRAFVSVSVLLLTAFLAVCADF